MGCLYLISGPSKRKYIGITAKTAAERFSDHVVSSYSKRTAVQRAIRKYGKGAFRIDTLLVANDWSYLCEMERRAIRAYRTFAPHGYNMTSGGEGVDGLCAESRIKHRNRTSEGTKNAWADEKHRAVQLATRANPDVRARIAAGVRAAKIWDNEEYRAKMLVSRNSPKYRKRVSEAVKNLWLDPGYRAKQMSRERQPRSEESKRAQSEKMKAYIANRKQEGTYWL